eukprot:2184391-Pyramimonas_sp.AAC.1
MISRLEVPQVLSAYVVSELWSPRFGCAGRAVPPAFQAVEHASRTSGNPLIRIHPSTVYQ